MSGLSGDNRINLEAVGDIFGDIFGDVGFSDDSEYSSSGYYNPYATYNADPTSGSSSYEGSFYWPTTSSEPSSLPSSYYSAANTTPFQTAIDTSQSSRVDIRVAPGNATYIQVEDQPSFNLPPNYMSTPIQQRGAISRISPPSSMASGRSTRSGISQTTPPSMTSGRGVSHVSEYCPPSCLASGMGASNVSKLSPPGSMATGMGVSNVSRYSSPRSMASGMGVSRVSQRTPPSCMASGMGVSGVSGVSGPRSMASGMGVSRVSGVSGPRSMASGMGASRVSGVSCPSSMASGGSRMISACSGEITDESQPSYMSRAALSGMAGRSGSSLGGTSAPRSLEGSPAPCGVTFNVDKVLSSTPSSGNISGTTPPPLASPSKSASISRMLSILDKFSAEERAKAEANLRNYQKKRRLSL